MLRKSKKVSRKSKRHNFQFEQLERREMFSATGGLTLQEILALRQGLVVEHQVETPGTPDDDPPAAVQAEQGIDNYLFLPMVTPIANGSAQVLVPFQLGADVIVNSNVDLSVRWSKFSGPGTATFTDATKIDSKVQFDQPGTYRLKLEAINNGYSGSGFVTITVDGVLETDPIAPELFDTTYSLPTGGTTHTPANGTEFQAALNAAQPGDVIVLQAGTTYTGNFSLPNNQGNGWIYIVSSELNQLPAGERVGIADATHMPKLVAADKQLPAIRTEFGSHHYRLAGIEVSTNVATNDLIRTGYGIPSGGTVWNIEPADTVEELPHNIVFDRMLIHSTSDSQRLRHGIFLNGNYMAVVDSYIANVKDTADAQAIVTDNGGGAYKIVNNFLEATGENYLTGGTDPAIPGAVSSDIEFRGNYLFKRLDWKTNDLWTVKNLFELKNSQRVLVSGNLMENNWSDGQVGTAIVLTVRNQSGTAPWSVVQDVNFENNIVKNVGRGISITGEDDLQSSQQTKRVRIHNNLFENVTRDYSTGPTFLDLGTAGRPILNLTVTKNTFLSPPDEIGPANHISLGAGTTVDGFIFKDNIMVHGSYNPIWSRVANADIANNALIMMPSNPRYDWNKSAFNNQHPGWLMADPGFGAVGFVDYANGNYALSATSPYKNSATNGGALGADVGALQQVVNQVSMALGTDETLAGLSESLFWGVAVPGISADEGAESEFDPLPPQTWQLEVPASQVPHDLFFDSVGTPTVAPGSTGTTRTIQTASLESRVDDLFNFLIRRQFGLRNLS